MMQDAAELNAIRNTLAAYNMAGDRLRLEALAALFLEDGVLETSIGAFRGRQEIIDGLGGRGRPAPTAEQGPTLLRHNLTTCHITVTSPDTAEARTYFMVLTNVGLDHAGHYVDRLRKLDGAWMFERRIVRIDWASKQSVYPNLREGIGVGKGA